MTFKVTIILTPFQWPEANHTLRDEIASKPRPTFFNMKLFDKTTEYCQCDFEAKYLDNMDFILS